ncbi:MAG: DUF885 domain-containing protein [Verrucomicrobiales bacterium]|nr:DUF885 domain-containing protein [Verrucomicrobiales bacterium]
MRSRSHARVLITLAGVTLLTGLAAAQTPDPGLTRFFQAYLDEAFALRPLDATRLGDHRFDRQLEDLSAPARARWQEHNRRTLAALPKAVDYARLPRPDQVDYEILRHELTKSLWLAENTDPFADDPRVYNDYINDSIYLLLAQSSLPAETNIANAIARLAHIPRVLEAARANLRHPPRAHTETAIRQNRGAVAFFERDLFELAGSTPQLAALRQVAAPVAAALRQYQSFLENDLRPRATGDWRLGRERFARKLELELDAGLTADEVLAAAQAEFDRVSRDMYVIARQLWSRYHPRQPLPPDDPEGRRTTITRVLHAIAQHHSTAATVLDDVRQTVAEAKAFIAAHDLLRLPDPDRCQIIEMPEFQRGNSTAYMNSPPPLDPHASGFYAVSPPPADWDADRVKSYFEEYNHQMLHILTIHEAYPGHYVQLEYANRVPSLIRRVLGSGTYIEGWAVYTEQTLLDQGYRDGDLALRLTQLKFYLRAVTNALLDHRMHCTAMTDDEALDLLIRQAFQSEGEARLKVIRAQQSSVQLSTYFVGRLAHYRLRQEIQRELGDAFELGRYHEAVLAPGPVPVKYLPELVRQRLQQPR